VSEYLRERWQALWQSLQAGSVPQDVLAELIQAYSSADRFYHNLTHLGDCLASFARTKSLAARPEEVELALWFHDAVYDTHRSDNEQRSADWVQAVIRGAGLRVDLAEQVSGLILATRHTAAAETSDAQLIVDVDLAILGTEADVFWKYEENIRKEYAWVPESLFRQQRSKILRGFLGRTQIYYHKQYREALEEKARRNLQQAIAKLMR
jgi:predicted metal-dependent HD superfamily phosphohydrolase